MPNLLEPFTMRGRAFLHAHVAEGYGHLEETRQIPSRPLKRSASATGVERVPSREGGPGCAPHEAVLSSARGQCFRNQAALARR
jgi:hypothetical protein